MGSIAGIILVFFGIVGYLYSWISTQKEKEQRIEEFLIFLQKSAFAMESEKVRIMEYFKTYETSDFVLQEMLQEISKRLSLHIYPNGQLVWEEVLKEKEQNINHDKETFGLMLRAGNGFFGRNRDENICFLQKSIKELEKQKESIKEKHEKERKVWIPVGMLGGVMLVIVMI